MKQRVVCCILVIFGAIGVATAASQTVYAQQPSQIASEISASPAITEWIVDPGQSKSQTILLVNQTDQPQPVRAFVQKFTPHEPIPQEAEVMYDASAWFSIDEPDFILKPRENREVTVRLHAPAEAAVGGHYATIYFQQLSPMRQNDATTAVAGRVGVLAFATVSGQISQEVTAVGEARFTRQNGNYNFASTLRNTGNSHVLPTVSFVVRDWRGREVAVQKVTPGLLLPFTERTYDAQWQPPFAGRFTVQPVVTYGNEKSVALAPLHIWQIPWAIVLPVITVATFGWFGVYKHRQRWQRAWRTLRHG